MNFKEQILESSGIIEEDVSEVIEEDTIESMKSDILRSFTVNGKSGLYKTIGKLTSKYNVPFFVKDADRYYVVDVSMIKSGDDFLKLVKKG